MFQDFIGIGEGPYIVLHFLVVLQQLDGQVTGGIAFPHRNLLLEVFLNLSDTILQFMAVIDVDVAEMRGISFGTFILLYDFVEEFLHALTGGEDGRHHGHTEELGKLVVIYMVASLYRLVEHVQRYHHVYVHINELGGEVEVALQVGCVDDIDDHIRSLLHQLLAYIKFLRGIGRKRVRARQVHQVELVALELRMSHLGIHGHTGVVPYPFMGTTCKVEQAGFSTVGIPDQGHIDNLTPFLRSLTKLYGREWLIGRVHRVCLPSKKGLLLDFYVPGLFLRDDLNEVRLAVAQRDLVAHDLVFHRILQRSIQQYFYQFALDKAHLDDSLTETTVA